MISQKFEISIREAEKRLVSTLQHKLRIVMKCYTIVNFQINENEHTFSFKKTNRIRGIVINDSKTYNGSFVLEKKETSIEGKEYILNVVIG
jgi:hypothetical protein